MGELGERVRRYFEACSEGDAGAIASHFSATAVVYDTNLRPVRGAEAIGAFWVKVRERWAGARWTVDTMVEQADAVAIEWTMTGTADGRLFAVHGSEHYRFDDGRIDRINQYWTFDPEHLDTGLVDFPYLA